MTQLEPFEQIVSAIRGAVDRAAAGQAATTLHAPPVIARSTVERAGYVHTFPRRRAEQGGTDLVLLPAACYHVYELACGAGLGGAHRWLIHATCFTQDTRLRSFRMSELVQVGPSDECVGWRHGWLVRATAWLAALGLSVSVELADEPRREQELRWVLRAPALGGRHEAVVSCNYHRDEFGTAFGISVNGNPAHTACVAFGLESLAVSLVHAHGPRMDRWPDRVRAALC